MQSFVQSVQQPDLDLYKLKGKTFKTVIAPTDAHKCSQTTFLGDYCEHSYIDCCGKIQQCACKCEIHSGAVLAKSVGEPTAIEFKIVATDYDTYVVKVTREGAYLLVRDPNDTEMIENLIKKYGIQGARINQQC